MRSIRVSNTGDMPINFLCGILILRVWVLTVEVLPVSFTFLVRDLISPDLVR